MLKKITLFLTFFCTIHAQLSTPVVILGGGMAGMTAALQVSQAGHTPIVVIGPTPGGIITVSHDVQNWPGELAISGFALADKIEEQLKARGVQLLTATVTTVDFSTRPFTIHVQNPIIPDEKTTIKAESCIITLGSTPNLLHVPGEESLLYKKIFTCAPCDGMQFKDKDVAVIGGGEGALVEAHYLSNIAKQVTVLVRKEKFNTIQPALIDRLVSKSNVKILYNTTVEAFKETSEGIELSLPHTNLTVQGAFLAIGATPNTSLLKNSVELDEKGYIVLKNGQSTSVPGVFAAGDVVDPTYNQAITAAGDATKAALGAISFMASSPAPQYRLQPAAIQEITDVKTLQSILKNSQTPVIAYFTMNNCPPCRAFKPMYQKWSEEYSDDAQFIKITVDNCPACCAAFRVDGFPTVIIFNAQGKEIKRATGTGNMYEILKFLQMLKQNQWRSATG